MFRWVKLERGRTGGWSRPRRRWNKTIWSVTHYFLQSSGPNWNWEVQGREGEGVQGQRDEERGQQGRHRGEDRGGHEGEDWGDEQERGKQQGGRHRVPSLSLLRYQAWGDPSQYYFKNTKLYCSLSIGAQELPRSPWSLNGRTKDFPALSSQISVF